VRVRRIFGVLASAATFFAISSSFYARPSAERRTVRTSWTVRDDGT
jgi:hypothetical protein